MLIYKKIPIIMQAVGAIEKGRKNTQQNYAFRGVDDITAAFQPILAAQGVFCMPEVLEQIREERVSKSGSTMIYVILKVMHTFYAEDGSKVCAVTVGEAMDSGDKASNKAMSSAFKYAFIETFCVPTEEDKDTENHSPQVAPKIIPTPQPTSGAFVGSFSSQDKTARVQQQIASKPVPPLEPEIPYADTPFEDYGSPAPANDHPAGNYEFPSVAKKYVGKKLKDVPMKELKEYATYMRNFMSSDGRTIRGKWVALFDAIDAYLGVR